MKSLIFGLVAIAVLCFITFGLGIEGLSSCQPGAIVMYFIGCFAYGRFCAWVIKEKL